MPPTKIQIVIEAIQYTSRHEPVLVQYSGKGITKGPLAKTSLMHTTQSELAKVSPPNTPDGYWSDAEVEYTLIEHLTESGISAEIAPPDPEPEQTGGIVEEKE